MDSTEARVPRHGLSELSLRARIWGGPIVLSTKENKNGKQKFENVLQWYNILTWKLRSRFIEVIDDI